MKLELNVHSSGAAREWVVWHGFRDSTVLPIALARAMMSVSSVAPRDGVAIIIRRSE